MSKLSLDICVSLHILFGFLPNINAIVAPSVTCGLHTSYILFTLENPFIYRHYQKTLFHKNKPPVTCQLHTLFFSSPSFLYLNSIYKSIPLSLIASFNKSLGFNRIAKKENATDYQVFTIIFQRFLFYFFSFLPSLNSYLRYVLPPVFSYPHLLIEQPLIVIFNGDEFQEMAPR